MANRYFPHFGTALLLHLLVFAGTWHISQTELKAPTSLGPLSLHSVKLHTAAGMILPHGHPHPRVTKKMSGPSMTSVKEEVSASAETSPVQGTVQGSGLSSGVGGQGEADLKSLYQAELMARIDQNKSYPMASRRLGQTGKVVVAFALLADGKITEVRLHEKSAFDLLNESALEAVKKVENFKPIPKEMNLSRMDLRVPVIFQQVR